MPQKILMPALSPTMEKGNLAQWHVKEGDAVKPGKLLAEIETDKAMMEYEAIDDGVIYKILVDEKSEDVPVNTAIAILREKKDTDADMEAFMANIDAAPQATVQTPAQTAIAGVASPSAVVAVEKDISCSKSRVFISPLAKRIAEQNKVDIALVQGTGPKGRIIKKDVEGFVAQEQTKPASRTISEVEIVPMSGMRKVIAKRLTESKQTIPHFYASIDVNVENLLAVRERINSKREIKLTINDFIVKALSCALVRNPKLNATFGGDVIHRYKNVDIAIAVSLEEGLITPIVKSAELKSIETISAEIKDLAKRAKEGKLKPEEYQGGTFSLSNMGMFGILEFMPIVNPPQVAIIGIGAAKNGSMIVTVSADHRAVDGTDVARFLVSFKEFIEEPMLMLV